VIHDVVEITIWNCHEITEPDLALLRAPVVDLHGLGALLKMVVIGLKLGFEPLGRGVLAFRFY
jgi:hypothetical protein